ncbi:RNA polymerase sigma factor [Amycolatopsis sp. FDAARGOS 1241]|nr:RNA polymerase sigma factor [Amycolatopsis sp. FDAARGOS 1241]
MHQAADDPCFRCRTTAAELADEPPVVAGRGVARAQRGQDGNAGFAEPGPATCGVDPALPPRRVFSVLRGQFAAAAGDREPRFGRVAGVEDRVLAGVERAALVEAITELPEHLREVLVLVLAEDLSYPEVATALGIPVGTVKSRMSHARRHLSARLSPSPARRSTP